MDTLPAAIEFLTQAAETPLDANDLGKLAQAHTACQTVAELEPGCAILATRIAKFLEAVILSEASDPAGGFALFPKAVALLKAGPAACGAGDAEALGAQFSQATRPGAAPTAAASVAPAPAVRPAASPPSGISPVSPSPRADAYVSEPLTIDMEEAEHLQGFVDESREHMDAIEAALLEVERAPGDPDRINDLFRPFHTIKGIAGFLNLRDINRLTHEVETILDMARRGEMVLGSEVTDLIFASIDKLKKQINELSAYLAAPTGKPVPQPDIVEIMGLLKQVQQGVGGGPVAAASASGSAAAVAKTVAPLVAGEPVLAGPATRAPAASRGPAAGGADDEQGDERRGVDTSIRVDTTKLDAIVDAVGELVIAQTMVNLNQFVRGDEKLLRDVAQVTKIVRDIQESALAMRMVPIGPTFQKMRRVLRDVSRKASKQVELRISGEETELDKNVIQAISDPLVHMVRNSVDHGVEPPEQRRAAGKPEQGQVHLHAYYQGDSIVIEISDDGRGLDREKLIAKAIERGVVQPGQQLSEPEAFALIFEAGFSTAAQVTDISGRGVGMDVVRRNIEALRGKIEIESQVGHGSTFRIRLPLTLAIIDGMLIKVGAERLIIPTIMIEQSLRPTREQHTRVQRKGEMIQVRGELLPLVRLADLFGYRSDSNVDEPLVVIVHAEGGKIGLVVDELIGQQQVVIKSLGESFKRIKGISGAAILGDGRVGLILEPTGLLRLHNESGGRRRWTEEAEASDPALCAAVAGSESF